MQSMERQTERLRREDERKQGKKVLEASAGPVPQHLRFHRRCFFIRSIDQLPALPNTSLHRHLSEHDVVYPLTVYLQARNIWRHVSQRPSSPVSHLEPPVGERIHQTPEYFDSVGVDEDIYQPPPDGKILVLIEEVLNQ